MRVIVATILWPWRSRRRHGQRCPRPIRAPGQRRSSTTILTVVDAVGYPKGRNSVSVFSNSESRRCPYIHFHRAITSCDGT